MTLGGLLPLAPHPTDFEERIMKTCQTLGVMVLGLSLALCALSVYGSATRLQYKTSRDDLLSPDKDYQKRWQQYLQEFGDDDDIVVVVKGADKERMKSALDALAEQVSRQPEHFDRLFYKVDLLALCNRALLFLPGEQIAQIQERERERKAIWRLTRLKEAERVDHRWFARLLRRLRAVRSRRVPSSRSVAQGRLQMGLRRVSVDCGHEQPPWVVAFGTRAGPNVGRPWCLGMCQMVLAGITVPTRVAPPDASSIVRTYSRPIN